MLIVEPNAAILDRVFQEEQCHLRQKSFAQAIGEDEEKKEDKILERTVGEECNDALDIARLDCIDVTHDASLDHSFVLGLDFWQHELIAYI